MKTKENNKKCPYCNSKKIVPLQKRGLFKLRRKDIDLIEIYQNYRCKRCKKEFRVQ